MPALSVPTAYYAASVADFLVEKTDSIIGALTTRSAFPVDPTQRDAWVGEISILREALDGINATVFLEFDVPRIGSRIDAVLVAGPAIFVIEFKVGERRINTQAFNQAWDYALDLKNFHLASHAAPILPILVATESDADQPMLLEPAGDLVFPPMTCNAGALGVALRLGLGRVTGANLEPIAWAGRRISRPRRSSRRHKRSTLTIPWTASRDTMRAPETLPPHPGALKRSSTWSVKPGAKRSCL